jgi:hypothetical protein
MAANFLPFNTFSHQNLKIKAHLFKLLPKCNEKIILSVQNFSSSRLFAPHIARTGMQVNVNVVGKVSHSDCTAHQFPHMQFRQ